MFGPRHSAQNLEDTNHINLYQSGKTDMNPVTNYNIQSYHQSHSRRRSQTNFQEFYGPSKAKPFSLYTNEPGYPMNRKKYNLYTIRYIINIMVFRTLNLV